MFALRWVVRRIGEFRGYRQRRPSAYCSLVAFITELWSDGACSGNPGPGGWAYILIARRPDGSVAKKLEGHGGEE